MRQSHEDAANRWGYAYYQITDSAAEKNLFGYKQQWMSEARGAHRILWADADLIFRHDCPDPCAIPEVGKHFVGVSTVQQWDDGEEINHNSGMTAFNWIMTAGAFFGIRWTDQAVQELCDTCVNGGLLGIIPDIHGPACAWLAKWITEFKTADKYIDEQALIPIAMRLFGHTVAILPWTYNRVGPLAWKPGPMRWYVQHLANCGLDVDKREALREIDWRTSAEAPAETPQAVS